MKTSEFNKLTEDVLDHMKHTLIEKAGQYSSDDDRLINFSIGGELTDTSPEVHAFHQMTKHIVSLKLMIDGKTGWDYARLREVCGDIRCFALLIEAILRDGYPTDKVVPTPKRVRWEPPGSGHYCGGCGNKAEYCTCTCEMLA